MTARRSFPNPCVLSAACDFLLSLLLKSHAPLGLLLSLWSPAGCSCESQTLASSSLSDKELDRVRITWTRLRLRGCSVSALIARLLCVGACLIFILFARFVILCLCGSSTGGFLAFFSLVLLQFLALFGLGLGSSTRSMSFFVGCKESVD
ncbi:hypothetical protein DY000_02042325 [Brassica cretica]|uniref:Transmembrane protein n=1 Tax=Brassica cretica TaxID=69181 RepID=A0ABQ7B5R3_BRACR|nr:hypothetical protein DY000_02042325 [Brassica cretica]